MADAKLSVLDSVGVTQQLDNESVTTGAGSGLYRQRVAAPETDALLTSIESTLTGGIPVTGTFFQTTQPISGTVSISGTPAISGTVTANAGTNLNTSALALETGGNLATLATATGATTDAAATAGSTGSLSAKLRLLTSQLATLIGGIVLAAGNAIIGKVGIDQTTPGTTNLVAAGQNGTWTVQPGNTANTTAWKVDNSGVTQPVSGTVSVSGSVAVTGTFFQGTQPVSAASLPLPTGAATAANQVQPGTAGTPSSSVASVQGVSGMTPLTIATADATASGSITTQNLNPLTGTATAASTVALTSLSGEGTLTVQVEGTYTGALSLQVRDDGTNWVTQTGNNTFIGVGGAGTATITSGSTGIWQVGIAGFQDVRIAALAAVTGTAVINLRASTSISQSVAVDLVTVNGSTISTGGATGVLATGGKEAHSNAAASNPVQVGGRVITTLDTTLTQGDVCYSNFTTAGQLIVKDYASGENDLKATSGLTPLAVTTSTQVFAAGAASIKNSLTGLQMVNTSTTVSTTVSILDGSTVIWALYLPASITGTLPETIIVPLPTPLKGSAATAMNIQLGTIAASVYWNAQGFQGF